MLDPLPGKFRFQVAQYLWRNGEMLFLCTDSSHVRFCGKKVLRETLVPDMTANNVLAALSFNPFANRGVTKPASANNGQYIALLGSLISAPEQSLRVVENSIVLWYIRRSMRYFDEIWHTG